MRWDGQPRGPDFLRCCLEVFCAHLAGHSRGPSGLSCAGLTESAGLCTLWRSIFFIKLHMLTPVTFGTQAHRGTWIAWENRSWIRRQRPCSSTPQAWAHLLCSAPPPHTLLPGAASSSLLKIPRLPETLQVTTRTPGAKERQSALEGKTPARSITPCLVPYKHLHRCFCAPGWAP